MAHRMSSDRSEHMSPEQLTCGMTLLRVSSGSMLEHKQVWFDFQSSLHHGRLQHGLHRIRKGMLTFLTPPRASLHSRSMAKSLNLGLRHENLQRGRVPNPREPRKDFFFLKCVAQAVLKLAVYMRVILNV